MDPLTTPEVDQLGRYNADRSRGLLFDAPTTERMRTLQRRFDTAGWFTDDGVQHNRLTG